MAKDGANNSTTAPINVTVDTTISKVGEESEIPNPNLLKLRTAAYLAAKHGAQ